MCFTTQGMSEEIGQDWGYRLWGWWVAGVGPDKAGCWAATEPLWLEGQGPKQNCFHSRLDGILGKVGGTESETNVQETQDPFERF